jgi:hypothetical protein
VRKNIKVRKTQFLQNGEEEDMKTAAAAAIID